MKLFVLIALLIVLPVAANAEVYKYKGANGGWVYSDAAPPHNIKQEMIGKKPNQPTGAAPLSKVDAVPVSASQSTEEQVATKRQQTAEQEKKNKEVSDAQTKEKEANCAAAKANYAAYAQGGRIYKANESGGRDYLDDKGIDAGKIQAKKDIDESCK